MSKSKQRARATREAQQQAAARARAAQRKAAGPQPARPAGTSTGKAAGTKPPGRRGKQPVYRQRRFPKLPWQLKLALGLGWLLVQVVVWLTIESLGTRIALGIISLAALPLLVVLVRDPSRRPPR